MPDSPQITTLTLQVTFPFGTPHEKKREVIAELSDAVSALYRAIGGERLTPRVVEISMFDDPFFKNKPAMASLEKIDQPSPELIRACLLEMASEIIKIRGEIVRLRRQEPEPIVAPLQAGK